MRKNVRSIRERGDFPMWYTAAAEYSRKKRMAAQLTTPIDEEQAEFIRRMRFYGRGNVLNPKHGSVVPNSRFGDSSFTSPPSRAKSPINPLRGSVPPTSRFGADSSRYGQNRSRSRSKSPTNVARGIATSTGRAAGGLFRVPTKTNNTLRNPFQREIVATRKPKAKGIAQIPRHIATNPLVSRSNFQDLRTTNFQDLRTSLANKSTSMSDYPIDVESDEDNEDKIDVVAVGTKASKISSNIVQLIVVEPSAKTKPPVQKIHAVRKERASTASVPSQISRGGKNTTPSKAEIVEPPTEQLQQEDVTEATEVREQPEAVPSNVAPDVRSGRATAGVNQLSSENVLRASVSEKEEAAPDVNVDVDGNLECPPEINVFQCFPNDCPSRNPIGPDITVMMCDECNDNSNNNNNLITACSVTEEHFLSFDADTELPPTSDSCWNTLPQFGISHYMYPGNIGQAQSSWHSNIQYPNVYSQVMPSRMSSYGYNQRPSFRQQQQQQQQQQNYYKPQMQRNSCCCMHKAQQQAMSLAQQQQQKQQQLQQQQQQLQQQQHLPEQQLPQQRFGLTELLAQQLQQQMQQAQAQIAQVQMQLLSVCRCTEPPQAADAADSSTPTEEQASDTAEESIELQPESQPPPPPCPCAEKPNVTFCTQPPSVCQPQCRNVASTAAAPPPTLLSLGFSPMVPLSEVNGATAAPNQINFAPQQQQQQQFQQPQKQPSVMLPSQCPGKHFFNPCCRQRYAQMRFMMPRCWQRH